MIEFDKMEKKKHVMYKSMWANLPDSFQIEKTRYKDKLSDNSYQFSNTMINKTNVESCADGLSDLFKIAERDIFRCKLKQISNGNGQELRRITTMHSSALCALLFFYNVTRDHTLELRLDDNDCEFYCSVFEYKNIVIKGRNPSNVDVVLIGTEKSTGQRVILFLESKFAEFYNDTSKELSGVSGEYMRNEYGKDIYEKLVALQKYILEPDSDDNFKITSKKFCYLEGIKQMISHYIGIRNLCNGIKYEEKRCFNELIKTEDAKIYLGTICYDKGFAELAFNNYQKQYSALVSILNDVTPSETNITVLPELLRYSQDELKGFVNDSIRKYYFEYGDDNWK